jgi:hypothetical protein
MFCYLRFECIVRCITLISLSALGVSVQTSLGCDAGKVAFEKETYPVIRALVCANCHSGSHPLAPLWAGESINQSYSRIKGFVDFSDLDHSKLLIQAGNGHCGKGCQNSQTKSSIKNSLKDWWDNGEYECQNYYLSSSLVINHQQLGNSYKIYNWDFSSLSNEWKGITFQAEVKAILSGDSSDKIAGFVIRNPKFNFANADKSLHVKGIHILVKNTKQAFTDNFASVDVHLDQKSSPVLSSDRMVLGNNDIVESQFSIALEYYTIQDR